MPSKLSALRVVGAFAVLSVVAMLVMTTAPVAAQDAATQWFTLTGDRDNARNNLVEILPEPVGMDQRVLLDLRVSRDQMRTSFRGKNYRSYYAKVVVDCTARRAWYLQLTYYALPLWVGAVTAQERYVEGEAEALFKDMSSEWSQRVVSAACRVHKP